MSRILISDENGQVVADRVILAESTRDRMRGLLGRNGLEPGTAMLIRPCRSIHMWFMRFSIDAAFLDSELNVLRIARDLQPWQIAFGPAKTCSALESASGEMFRLNPGDRLFLDS